jgi:hypothetical protein
VPRAATRLTSPSASQAAPAASSPITRLPIPLCSVIQTVKYCPTPRQDRQKFTNPYCGLRDL